MKNYKKARVKSVKIEDFNFHLRYLDGSWKIFRRPKEGELLTGKVFIYKDNRGNQYLLYKDAKTKKAVHIKCDPVLDEIDPYEDFKVNAGASAMKSLTAKLRAHNESIETNDQPTYIDDYTWHPFTWYDINNSTKDLTNIWQYDLNSAYLYFMSKPLPYGDSIAKNREVCEGEIGFNFNTDEKGVTSVEAVFNGFAEKIFKTKVYKSFIDYINFRGKEMSKIKDHDQRQAYKIRTYALHGNLKYHNIFISSAIVGYCKELLLNIKKDNPNIIMNTVDSITSIGPIKGLNIGTKIGQFKIEHQNENFYYYTESYKIWNDTDELHKGLDIKRKGISPKYYYDIERNRMELCQDVK